MDSATMPSFVGLGDSCFFVVVSVMSLTYLTAPVSRSNLPFQVYALAALSDQADQATFHIVRYHQAWMEDDRLYIQTELCTGTLADENARGRLPEPRRYKLLREMLLALDFIHRNNMVHLDVKPEVSVCFASFRFYVPCCWFCLCDCYHRP